MNHPYLIGVGLAILTVASYWGLMKLEARRPKKASKRRWAKRRRRKGRGKRRKFLKRLFHFTRKEIFLAIGLLLLFTWLFAVIIKDLPLTIISTALLVGLNNKFQSLK